MAAHAISRPPEPYNEPVKSYAPGSPERAELRVRLTELAGEQVEIPLVIGGKDVELAETFDQVMPHDKAHVLAKVSKGDASHVQQAIDAAAAAWNDWSRTPWEERAAVLLRAADLLTGPWRATLNAATMLGQSKTAHQAEIDAACELADFWRFNVSYMTRIYEEQPISSPGVWNRLEYRPLEGFVFAVTPFNFTAIGGNLPTSPALMGNTVVWKPASTAALLRALPHAVAGGGRPTRRRDQPRLRLRRGDRRRRARKRAPRRRALHRLDRRLPEHVEDDRRRTSPATATTRASSARPAARTSSSRTSRRTSRRIATAIVRGSFEYQGQKCSAASRLFIPDNIWPELRERLATDIDALPVGDVRDFGNFMGAVIDGNSFKTQATAIDEAKEKAKIVAGGSYDDSEGWFVRPTVVETDDPDFRLMKEELFGPVVTAFVYPHKKYDETLDLVDNGSPYGLTGAVFARDRGAIEQAGDKLRYTAGNFYVNDKPTGAVVGQQPFGGARASGTNDKAGSLWNLIRWVSPRTVKETFVPPSDYRYPFMEPDTTGSPLDRSRRGAYPR